MAQRAKSASSNKITDPQRDLLKRFNVIPPPTKKSASRMIGYILRGNGIIPPDDQDGRIKLVQEAQERWHGKKISYSSSANDPHAVGTVEHLVFRTVEDINAIREKEKDLEQHERQLLAYCGFVRWDAKERKPAVRALGLFTVVE